MQLKSIAVVLVCASSLAASPLSTAPTNRNNSSPLVELHREQAQGSEGYLIYLGSLTATATATATAGTTTGLPKAWDIQKRASPCLKSETKCSTSHSARNGNCDELVAELGGDSRTLLVPNTRQVCYKGDSSKNDQCCLSVGNVISKLSKGDVVDSAATLLSTCTESGISGKMTNVLLKETCTSVCLSNHQAWCF